MTMFRISLFYLLFSLHNLPHYIFFVNFPHTPIGKLIHLYIFRLIILYKLMFLLQFIPSHINFTINFGLLQMHSSSACITYFCNIILIVLRNISSQLPDLELLPRMSEEMSQRCGYY